MDTIDLQDDLRKALEQRAERQGKSVAELVNEAVRGYLHESDEDAIDREQEAFEALHPELVGTHWGKWVAVYGGRVVDADEDTVALHQRVRLRFGNAPVLVTRVSEKPIEEFWLRSPRIERQTH